MSDSPRKVMVALLLLVVLAFTVMWRVQPELVRKVLPGSTPRVTVARFEVPQLPPRPKLEAPSAVEPKRNLFTFGAAPTPTPDPRPTPTPVPRPVVPPAPPPPTPTPPGVLLPNGRRLPPPPPFSLPYLGWLGPKATPVAVFRDNNDVLVVPKGGVIKEKFVVRDVGPTGVTIGYVGYPENLTTQVPLAR